MSIKAVSGGGGIPSDGTIVTDGQSIAIWNASDDNRGNVSAFVNSNFLTAVRLPSQNDVVSGGSTKPLSMADNTGLLAMVTAHVPADTNTFESMALPANAAVVTDGQASVNVDQFDGTGDFAASVAVAANVPSFKLANATTRIGVNALSVTISSGAKSAPATMAIVQVAFEPFPLSTATDALVSDTDPVTIKNSGGTTLGNGTVVVAANAVTQITADISAGPSDGSAISMANNTGSISVNGTYHTAGPSAALPDTADIVQSNQHVMVQDLSGSVSITDATVEFLNSVLSGITLTAVVALIKDAGQVTVPVDGVNKVVTFTVTDGAIASMTTADP